MDTNDIRPAVEELIELNRVTINDPGKLIIYYFNIYIR